VMLFTGLVISTLTARVSFQAEAAREREQRTAALYATTRELSALDDRKEIIAAGLRHVTDLLAAEACILIPDVAGHMTPHIFEPRGYRPNEREEAVARWVFEHGQAAGRGTSTLPGGESLHLPLAATTGVLGVLVVRLPAEQASPGPAQFHLLEALSGLIALSLERAALAHESEQRLVQIEAEKLRNSLLSAVSHDLRTPLAAIAGASSTLLEAEHTLPPAARRELTQSIVDETDRLNRLVVAVRLPGDLPLVAIDDVLMQQVLVNLLENAVKYAPADTLITLAATARPGGVTIEVADEGPGIPPGDEERIFDKFHRGSVAGGRAGVGLGLAICRGIVGLHGGRIWVENRPHGGAAFRFTLPIEGTPPNVDAATAESGAAPVSPPSDSTEPQLA
jgi:two-component system sensor histidine kinase KdpD